LRPELRRCTARSGIPPQLDFELEARLVSFLAGRPLSTLVHDVSKAALPSPSPSGAVLRLRRGVGSTMTGASFGEISAIVSCAPEGADALRLALELDAPACSDRRQATLLEWSLRS
jgi:hypothetical protein